MDTDKTYERDKAFWEKYFKGRPQIPESLFERVCKYHSEHGGQFDTVHDVGAGPGVHSHRLAKYFQHVVISDVAPSNIELAKERLGTQQYSYRARRIEDADAPPAGSVDMVFAAAMMHFVVFDQAFEAIARQLKPGGTFVAFLNGIATLHDERADDVWRRLWWEGQHILLRLGKDRKGRLQTVGRTASGYDAVPVPEKYFLPGALRVTLNSGEGWPVMLPPDLQSELETTWGSINGEALYRLALALSRSQNSSKSQELTSILAVSSNEQRVYENEPGWSFKADMQDLRNQFDTFPFAGHEPEKFAPLWQELEAIVGSRTIEGTWPARFILATRK